MGTQRPTRRMWWGFTDIGRIQIPPNPQFLVLTDRATGQLWWVTFQVPAGTADGYGLVAINSVLPCNTNIDGAGNGKQNVPTPRAINNCAIYPAYDEPVVGIVNDSTYTRLIVRGSRLGVEVVTVNKQFGIVAEAPPITLIQDTGVLGFNGRFVSIILDTVGATNGAYLVWVPGTLTQTPNPSPVQTYD